METLARRRRYYTPQEVSYHNCAEDCWVSIFYKVYDLTSLIARHKDDSAVIPIIKAAGTDISHWFNEKTGEVVTRFDAKTGLELPYLPHGHFLHVPPPEPVTDWATDFKEPWWRDSKYVIGKLTRKTREIEITNTLTQQVDRLTVCSEETFEEIRDRYLDCNAHAESYTWKYLYGDEFLPVKMRETLEGNGITDEDSVFEKLGITDEQCTLPVIHIYFNDDLTVA